MDISLKRLDNYLSNRTQLINYDGEVRRISNNVKSTYLSLGLDNIGKLDDAIEMLNQSDVVLQNKVVVIDIEKEAYMSTQQCEKLLKTRQQLRLKGCDLKITDGDFYDIEDVLFANQHLDTVVEQITTATVEENGTKRPLNELEKFLMAYSYVANRKYHENKEDLMSSRSITSILKTGDIVCVGFATLLKELCNRIGIECYINSCEIRDKKDGKYLGGHANNVVMIGGKPYYCDSCWDCLKDNGNKYFNYCLIPFEDTKYFTDCAIKKSNAPFTDIEQDKKEILEALEILRNTSEDLDLSNYYFKLTTSLWFRKYQKLATARTEINENDISMFNFQQHGNETAERYLKEMLNIIIQHQDNKSIQIEDIESALINVYQASGKIYQKCKEITDKIIDDTTSRAGKIFEQGASNCFAQEYNKNLEL